MNSSPSTESSSQTSPSAAGIKQSVVDTARQTTAKIKSAASATAARAAEGVQKTVTDKRTQAADRVEAYGSAIHDSAKSLEQEDPNIAWFTHQAADRLQGIATYVRERDFQGLRQDAENLARRHPVAFFGGLCLAGLVLGNIVKASRQESEGENEEAADFSGRPEDDYAPASQPIDETASAEI